MGKASRDKGKRGEREVASILNGYGFDAHRGVQYHGGKDSPDVVGIPGVHIEVKRVEALHLWDAIEQAKNDAGSEEIPAVFHRKNGKPWVVVISLDDFIQLYKGWQTNGLGDITRPIDFCSYGERKYDG